MNANQRTDEIVTKAVGVALIAACIPMWWWDYHWPSWLVDIINPVLVTTTAYLLARWKRSRGAWGAFWLLVGIYIVALTLWAVSGLGLADTSGPGAVAGLALIGLIVCLLRLPRWHPPEAPKVEHVWHHHVLHHPDGRAVEVGQDGTVQPVELDAAAWPAAVRRRPPIALENLVNRPGLLDHGLAARLREVRRRRA